MYMAFPHFLETLEAGNQQVQKLDVVENMHERKAKCMIKQMALSSYLAAWAPWMNGWKS